MRKTVLYIAMSLDGYVAGPDGGVDWLKGQDPDNKDGGSYGDFIKSVDTVIMGYTTYYQIVTELAPGNWPYQGLQSYVLTHRGLPDEDGVLFTDRNLKELVDELKAEAGRDIWILGGASIVNQLIEADRIDQYRISVIPVLLGDGIRLFSRNEDRVELRLEDISSTNGIVELTYSRR